MTAGRPLARLGAIVLLVAGGTLAGLLLLVAVELGLRALGIGGGRPPHDPFAGFSRVVPLFEPTTRPDGTAVFALSAARLRSATGKATSHSQHQFLATKPPGTFRIFVVGESSAAGVPYGTNYAFPMWLARRLDAELPGVAVEVVNAAVSGYGSRRVLEAVREIAKHAADLVIVYSGHNEFAERRFYAHLVDLDPRIFRLWELVVDSRLYALLSGRFGAASSEPPPRFDPNDVGVAGQMFAAARDRASGRTQLSANETEYAAMLYRRNLEGMADETRRAGGRTLFVGVAQNLADWAPGASQHRPDLDPAASAAFDAALADGDGLAAAGRCDQALGAYERALAIDATFAAAHFGLATCLRTLGRFADAQAAFRRASDLDAVPQGIPSRFTDVLRDVARERGALFLDADARFVRESPHGLVGDPLFADFVHPSIRGHQIIAAAIAETLRAAGVPVPADRWRVGAYADPDPAGILADNPKLRVREHLMRALACDLALRVACALAEADAVLALEPTHVQALQLRHHLTQEQRPVAGESPTR
jgi:lysophospholipase L1-like esterase